MAESRFLVLPESALEGGTVEVVALPDAKHGERQMALASGVVLELSVMQRRLGSFLVDDSVHGTGKLYVGTPVDALFVVLPLLAKVRDRARPFQELLSEGGDAYLRLARCVTDLEAACRLLCDVTEIPGLEERFFRLNNDKVLRWLLCKMDAIVEAIQAGQAGRSALGSLAVSKSLVMDQADDAPQAAEIESIESQRMAAIEILGEYVGPEWASALYRNFGLSENVVKNEQFAAQFENANRVPTATRIGNNGADQNKAAEPKKSRGQKQLEKADKTGMSKLTQFFAPKRPAKVTTPKKPRSSPRKADPSPSKKKQKTQASPGKKSPGKK